MSRRLVTGPAAAHGAFLARCACWGLRGWLREGPDPERPRFVVGVRVDVDLEGGGLWLVAHNVADPRHCLPGPVLSPGVDERAAAIEHLTVWAQVHRARLCWGSESAPPPDAWRPPVDDVPELGRNAPVVRGELWRIGPAGLPLAVRRRASEAP